LPSSSLEWVTGYGPKKLYAIIREKKKEDMTTTSQGQFYMQIAVEELALRLMSEGYKWNTSAQATRSYYLSEVD